MADYDWGTGPKPPPHTSRSGVTPAQQATVPVDMHFDGEPTAEQRVRKWALKLAIELHPQATADYVIGVADKFELFIAAGERNGAD